MFRPKGWRGSSGGRHPRDWCKSGITGRHLLALAQEHDAVSAWIKLRSVGCDGDDGVERESVVGEHVLTDHGVRDLKILSLVLAECLVDLGLEDDPLVLDVVLERVGP